ncbi:DarT1-associated NADAR antitoxin family protein [Comamonas sp. MYb396]|uniref:DarT1-associated NADAR antitoxin family protein n=1 Tax=Comamonas sp. MYb396 TaxID=2745302 RepID=UPI0030A5062D
MASRPIFSPSLSGPLLVQTHSINFQWFPGMAKVQSQKSIASLHENAKKEISIQRILEISSKSPDDIGVNLSAFNLMVITPKGREYSLECAYQASKVFEYAGPFPDMLEMSSIEAKKDSRLKTSGNLLKFSFYGRDWDLLPRTAFYDWLYINALHRQPALAEQVLDYQAFSDIAFNPEKSINCQAYAAALYVSLHRRGLITSDFLKNKESYLEVIATGEISNAHEDSTIQNRLI